MRTIGSTVVGQAVDSILVITIIFAGTVPISTMLKLMISGYGGKVIYEALATPLHVCCRELAEKGGRCRYHGHAHQLQSIQGENGFAVATVRAGRHARDRCEMLQILVGWSRYA